MTAVGVAGGVALSETTASPARAAGLATTVEQGALAPAVVTLADAATIAVDASLGNDFRVTIAGNRTMGNPANPADGQKITFQITQGSAGSSTITWGSAYSFATSLPQPTLSTTAGQTDLLGFHLQRGQGQVAARRVRERLQPTPVVTQPKGTYRLFPSTNGPSSPVSYSGPFLSGVVFGVTSRRLLAGRLLVVGVRVRPVHLGAEVRALVRLRRGSSGTLVAGSAVTSGALTAGHGTTWR